MPGKCTNGRTKALEHGAKPSTNMTDQILSSYYQLVTQRLTGASRLEKTFAEAVNRGKKQILSQDFFFPGLELLDIPFCPYKTPTQRVRLVRRRPGKELPS